MPSPDVAPDQLSGTIIKAWDTLTEVGQTSMTTLAVSVSVLLVLIVFERWIPAIPGGLVAVVGAIVVSSAFDLQAHGVAILGPVPGGLPSVELPEGVGWSEVRAIVPVAVSMFLVIIAQSAATSRAYAVRYRERFVENTDIVGLSAANIAAGLTGTFVVNGSPTKTEMVDEAHSHTQVAQLTTAVTVALVLLFLTGPLRYLPEAVLSAVVFYIGVKLVDVRGLRRIRALRRDEFRIAVATAITVVGVGVEQGIILAVVLSILVHLRRHYDVHDAVLTWSTGGDPVASAPTPGTVSEPGLVVYRFGVGVFFANASRLIDEATALVDVTDPPRWFVLDAEAMDDVDFTGGQTLAELAAQVKGRGVTFAVAAANDQVRGELDRFGVTAAIGEGHVFNTVEEARAAFRSSG